MLKFKKIASLMASTLMVGSTVALAAAATYPAPFVSGGSPNVGIVYGSSAAITDLVAATNIMDNLNTHVVGTSSTGSTTTVSGEAYPLFTSGSPLLLNASLNSVRTTLTSNDLPTILEDGTFQSSTNVDYTQRILIGSTPKLEFKQQPSGSDDPQLGYSLSTTPSTGYIYNATVTFDENVNFTHSDSHGEELELFGQKFTVSSATTSTKLVLLKSSQEITLTNDDPSAEVVVDGETYVVELVSASDTDATIRVTDADGNSNSNTISESASRTIQGLEVAVDSSDENNFQLTATILLGSSRVTLQDGSTVKIGTDDDTVQGTQVEFETTAGASSTPTAGIGKIIFQATTRTSDEDAIFPESSFVDPVFGSFKVDFSGVTVPLDSTSREEIKVQNSGSDLLTINFRSHDGTEAVTTDWVYNDTDSQGTGMDLADNDAKRIIVSEMGNVNKSEYVVLASDKEGGLYKVMEIYNESDSATGDYVTLQNIFTGESQEYKAATEGSITGITEQGRTFSLNYYGTSNSDTESRYIKVNYDESSSNDMILFPTISTSMGAKVAFYEPTTVNISSWDGTNSMVGSNFKFQDGDGYTTAAVAGTSGDSAVAQGAFQIASTEINESTSKAVTVGALSYNFTYGGVNTTTIYLRDPTSGSNIDRPALIVFEEKDDAGTYGAMVVTVDAGYDGDSAGIGVSDVARTWGADGVNNEVRLESDSDMYQEMDIWGSLITLDKSDSDQTTAVMSYPDEQLTAMAYIAEESAAISTTGGSTGSGTTVGVPLLDSEVSSASGKNLIVVGGSCVNTVAADLLGSSSPLCTADFTASTGVGAGQYLIETFSRSSGTVATLVAGYNAADTTNAATALRTQSITTDVGTKYIGTTSTSLEMQTEAAE